MMKLGTNLESSCSNTTGSIAWGGDIILTCANLCRQSYVHVQCVYISDLHVMILNKFPVTD